MTANYRVVGLVVLTLVAPAAFAAGQLGDPAPALQIADWVKGVPVDLAAGKGTKVYVIAFWATSCEPCRTRSIPRLTALQRAFKSSGVTVIGITDGSRKDVDAFLTEMGDRMDYSVAIDRDRKTSRNYTAAGGLDGTPYAYVIDKTGAIVWHGHPMNGLGRVVAQVIDGSYDVESILKWKKADSDALQFESLLFPVNDYFESYESLDPDTISQIFHTHIPDDADYLTPKMKEALLASVFLYYKTYLEDDPNEPLTEFTRMLDPRGLKRNDPYTRARLFEDLAVGSPVSPVAKIAFPEVPLVVSKGFSKAEFLGTWSDGKGMDKLRDLIPEIVSRSASSFPDIFPDIDIRNSVLALSRNLFQLADGTYRFGLAIWIYQDTLGAFFPLLMLTMKVLRPAEEILPFMRE